MGFELTGSKQKEAREHQMEEHLHEETLPMSRQDDFVRLQAREKGKARVGDESPEPRLVGEDGRPRRKEVVLTDQGPGLLGGTLGAARAYMGRLTPEERKSYRSFRSAKAYYTKLKEIKPWKRAKDEFPVGCEVDLTYNKIRKRRTDQAEGESSRAAEAGRSRWPKPDLFEVHGSEGIQLNRSTPDEVYWNLEAHGSKGIQPNRSTPDEVYWNLEAYGSEGIQPNRSTPDEVYWNFEAHGSEGIQLNRSTPKEIYWNFEAHRNELSPEEDVYDA